jgi:hypothetical protein
MATVPRALAEQTRRILLPFPSTVTSPRSSVAVRHRQAAAPLLTRRPAPRRHLRARRGRDAPARQPRDRHLAGSAPTRVRRRASPRLRRGRHSWQARVTAGDVNNDQGPWRSHRRRRSKQVRAYGRGLPRSRVGNPGGPQEREVAPQRGGARRRRARGSRHAAHARTHERRSAAACARSGRPAMRGILDVPGHRRQRYPRPRSVTGVLVTPAHLRLVVAVASSTCRPFQGHPLFGRTGARREAATPDQLASRFGLASEEIVSHTRRAQADGLGRARAGRRVAPVIGPRNGRRVLLANGRGP